MSVAVLITEDNQIDDLIGWGRLLADSEETRLIILVLQKSSATKQWIEIDSSDLDSSNSLPAIVPKIAKRLAHFDFENCGDFEHGGDSGPSNLSSGSGESDNPTTDSTTIRILKDQKPEWALVDDIDTLDIKLLVMPRIAISKTASEAESWGKSLYREAPCETMQLDCQSIPKGRPLQTMVIVTGGADDLVAIQRAVKLSSQIFCEDEAKSEDESKPARGLVSAVYFQPPIDPVAIDVGKKILNGIVDNAVGKNSEHVQQKVVLANGLRQGIKQLDLGQYDLVICGTRNMRDSIRFLSNNSLRMESGDKNDNESRAPSITLATVRKPVPLASRFVNKLREIVDGFIPQLKRDQRIELVNRIQSSSKWDFDFGILISLSTLIAALGLIRNSPSVVIGAMLVAPLMTPIVGAGLGLAQSNIQLVRNSLRTVVKGFATAFLIGIVVGLLTQATITEEMNARGSPNFLDLVVALVSGIAAAYAMGRPNLLSALPGVAIAAALVPPLATSGMATALGDIHLAYGSLLLFCTNIVAIILGTAFTFWTVGVRRNQGDSESKSWPLWVFLTIVLLSIGLTVMMSFNSPVTGQIEILESK